MIVLNILEYYFIASVTYFSTSSILWLMYRLNRQQYLLPTSFMLYMLLLTISQFYADKIGQIGPVFFNLGIITYSATVAILDYIVLKFGKSYGMTLVRVAVISQILISILNYLVIEFPPAQFWSYQQAFSEVMGVSARVVVGSVFAFFTSQTYDTYLVSRIKGGVIKRVGMSDPVSMTIDSLVFVPVAFYGVLPNNVVLTLMLYQIVGKLLLTPLTITAVWLNRKALNYGTRSP